MTIKSLSLALAMTLVPALRPAPAQDVMQPQQVLGRNVAPLKVSGGRLEAIVESLGGSAGVGVKVPWDDYLKRDAKFDVNLSDVTLGSALDSLFNMPPRVNENGTVTVGIDDPAEVGAVTIRYSVGDLARAVSPMPEHGMEQIHDLIERTVRSDSWHDNGGTWELIVAGDTLVVSQTRGGHAEVREFLNFLRKAVQSRANQRLLLTAATPINQPVGNAKFANVPLREVFQRLADSSHVSMVVDLDSLENNGVVIDMPISMDLSNLTLGRALEMLIWQKFGGKIGVDFDEGILTIRAKEPNDGRTVTSAYDVRPIIESLAADPPTDPTDPAHTPLWQKATSVEATDQLTRLIEDLVDTETWRDNGGAIGQISFFADEMIITSTPHGHAQTRQLLAVLDQAVATRPAGELGGALAPVPAAKPFSDAVINLDFDNTSLEEALKSIADQTDARIFINWKVLEAAGIDGKTPVTVKIKGVRGRNALDLVLAAAGGGQAALSAIIDDDGVVRISTVEANQHDSVTMKFYNIQPLIEAALRVQRSFNQGVPNAPSVTSQDVIDNLTKAIEDNIDTESWKDNGGAVGSLRIFANTLIVTTTASTQEKLAAFLGKLRAEVGRSNPGGR